MANDHPLKTRILVWDTPTRLFHWLLALCFAGAYATSEGNRLIGLHLTLGYTMVGLVAFRVVWGIIGTRYARFTSFMRGPETVASYASDMLNSKADYPVGHNPLGAVAIALMLLSTLLIVYTGWVYFNGGAHSDKELHEGAAGLMLALVGLHVTGVLFTSMMQQENLALSMLHGHKQGRKEDGIRGSRWPVAVLLLAGVLVFWWLAWQNPPGTGGTGYPSEHHNSKHHTHDGHDWRDDDD